MKKELKWQLFRLRESLARKFSPFRAGSLFDEWYFRIYPFKVGFFRVRRPFSPGNWSRNYGISPYWPPPGRSTSGLHGSFSLGKWQYGLLTPLTREERTNSPLFKALGYTQYQWAFTRTRDRVSPGFGVTYLRRPDVSAYLRSWKLSLSLWTWKWTLERVPVSYA